MIRILLILLLVPTLAWGGASRDFLNNDEVELGDVLDVTSGDLTLCAWAEFDEDASADFIHAKKAGSSSSADPGYGLVQTSSDFLQMVVVDTAGDGASSIGSTDLDGAWHSVCGTWDSSATEVKAFVDGIQEDNTIDATIDTDLSNAGEVSTGENSGEGGDSNGRYAYVLHWTRELLDVEIAEVRWKPDAIVGNLEIFWTMWGATGDATEIDYSGNGRDGTVQSSPPSQTDGPPVMFGSGLPI